MTGRMYVSNYGNKRSGTEDLILLEDNFDEMGIVDTRKYVVLENNSIEQCDDVPESITGVYSQDYNISYIDAIIRRKLSHEKFSYIKKLKLEYQKLEELSKKPQTYLSREKTLDSMKILATEISDIESGNKLKTYIEKVKNILEEYHKYDGVVKTVVFGVKDQIKINNMTEEHRKRIHLIDLYLEIAKNYIAIDVIRVDDTATDLCNGCGISLEKVATNEDGTIRCPNPECQTEHSAMMMAKLAKDGSRINMNVSTDDESIDNFLRAFMRFQGLQQDKPNESLYDELDEYFTLHDRPKGSEIRKLPLNKRGRRG